MKKLLFFIMICALGIDFSNAQTPIPGGSVSGTWTLTGSPYLIQGDITIPNGQTLNIMPGVRVEFKGTYKLLVQGRVLAIGIITDTINWTATDTIAGWHGIRFDNTPETNDSSRFTYCKFQYSKTSGSSSPDNYGGSFFIKNFSKVAISYCRISNCDAYNGGGIYCYYSHIIISNNTITHNTADWGGGIYSMQSLPVISNNMIAYNSITANGGGIFCSEYQPLITNNTIVYNSGASQGGGIYCDKGGQIITNNIISNNQGGGIFCMMSSATISNNLISKNSGVDGGGISCVDYGLLKISNNTISNNYATSNGGGIYCEYSRPLITNNTITNNSVSGYGGGIYIDYYPTLSNNTIVNNNAVYGGGLFCESNSTPNFSNTILYGNTATYGQQVCLKDTGSNPNFYYCDIQGDTTLFYKGSNIYKGTYSNNIDSNPEFISPSTGSGIGFDGVVADWSLNLNSPCIDRGDPSETDLLTDKSDNPRVVNIIDIGAYEFQRNNYFGGYVFYDVNNNCKKDSGEMGINMNLIKILAGPHFTCTDKKGRFVNNHNDTGNLIISYVKNNGIYTYWHLSSGNPAQYNIHITPNIRDTNNNFGILPTLNVKDLRVFLTGLNGFRARPGRYECYTLVYENIGTTTISSGSLNLKLDTRVNLQSANPNYTSYTHPNASWSFLNIKPSERRQINLIIKIDTSLSVDDSIYFYTSILPTTGDSDITNNYDTLKQIIVAAIDPNDKQCSPYGNILPQTLKIDYLIRFQNTGNHVAYKVKVVDTISENLPLTKVLLKTTSHPYELQVRDNVLIWTFNNIMLPDSTSDEPNSHGYISYSAYIKPGLAIGTKITNKAYIYFDYQLPISTRSTINIITKLDDIEEPAIIENNDYRIYPNPASGLLNIIYLGTNQNQELFLMNSLGQMISCLKLKPGEKEEINISNIPNGLYLIRDIKEGKVNKIIVNH